MLIANGADINAAMQNTLIHSSLIAGFGCCLKYYKISTATIWLISTRNPIYLAMVMDNRKVARSYLLTSTNQTTKNAMIVSVAISARLLLNANSLFS